MNINKKKKRNSLVISKIAKSWIINFPSENFRIYLNGKTNRSAHIQCTSNTRMIGENGGSKQSRFSASRFDRIFKSIPRRRGLIPLSTVNANNTSSEDNAVRPPRFFDSKDRSFSKSLSSRQLYLSPGKLILKLQRSSSTRSIR